jgi:BRO family, N-terminal domain
MDDEENISSDMALAVLEEQADATIRRADINGIWYFSVVDVIAILTDAPKPRQYWFNMKRYIKSEGFVEVSQKVRQTKLPASDGKYYATDGADVETMLRIIQSVPSPKAEPIKQWLARVGAEHLEAERRPVEVAAPTSASPIAQAWVTSRPADDDLLGWAEFLERMAMVYRQQAHLEARVRYVETAARGQEARLESLELRVDAVEKAQSTLPELLDLLKPEQLSQLHQTMLSRWVNDLAHLTGWHISMIYQDLVADFAYQTFSDATESDWQRIADWFQARLEAARKRR